MDVKGEVEAMIAPCLTSSAGGEGAYFDDNQSLVVVEAAEGIAICIFNKMSLLKSF